MSLISLSSFYFRCKVPILYHDSLHFASKLVWSAIFKCDRYTKKNQTPPQEIRKGTNQFNTKYYSLALSSSSLSRQQWCPTGHDFTFYCANSQRHSRRPLWKQHIRESNLAELWRYVTKHQYMLLTAEWGHVHICFPWSGQNRRLLCRITDFYCMITVKAGCFCTWCRR